MGLPAPVLHSPLILVFSAIENFDAGFEPPAINAPRPFETPYTAGFLLLFTIKRQCPKLDTLGDLLLPAASSRVGFMEISY